MDLQMGQLITRPKVVDIPITDVLINGDNVLVEEQGFNSLQNYNKKREKLFSLM